MIYKALTKASLCFCPPEIFCAFSPPRDSKPCSFIKLSNPNVLISLRINLIGFSFIFGEYYLKWNRP